MQPLVSPRSATKTFAGALFLMGSDMTSEVQDRRIRAILLEHLLLVRFPCWPGSDSLTLDDVVRTYLEASQAGLVPDCAAICRKHPDLVEACRRLFAPSAN
jgi:hypothetical protein